MSNVQSILPPNASELEKAVERVTARRLAVLEEAAMRIPDLWDPMRCPVAWLETLADALSVDVWSSKWSEEVRRSMIAASISTHRIKGTVAAVRAVLQAAGLGDADIIEGAANAIKYDGSHLYGGADQYGGDIGTWAQYDVILKQPISADQAADVRRLLDSVAPARCELRYIRYREANVYDGSLLYDGVEDYAVVTDY